MEPSVTLEAPREAVPDQAALIDVRDLSFYYGAKLALEHITIGIQPNVVTAFIGPSGCGKSTFLRTLNRMNRLMASCGEMQKPSPA